MAKRTYYLIDTENVGDKWQSLTRKIKKKDQMIFFYSTNHSKGLEEFLAKHVHNPHIQWLECVTGTNALDYQLICIAPFLGMQSLYKPK